MISSWKATLLANAGAWGLPQDGNWSFLLHNNYHPHCSNINLLWFHPKNRFPRVVTKLYREPEILRREYDNLTRAHRSAPALVPRPLRFEREGSFWALWMEGVPGWRRFAHERLSSAHLRSMAEAVACLHAGLAKSAIPTEDRYERLVTAPLAAVAAFGGSAAVKGGCRKMAERITTRKVADMRVIPQHGDLSCENLLADGNQWHIIDWESLGTVDLPFYDLVTLLLSLLGVMERPPEQWRKGLVEKAPALVECYARALRLPADAVRTAIPLTLVNWFHLQWKDGRKRFTELMYPALHNYFTSPERWEKVFLRA
jgi:aminoglycoside phosphotransferase (APT) family kinase protein